MAAHSSAAAAGGKPEKRSLRDFKKKVATGSRHQSLTVGALSIEALREQHAAESAEQQQHENGLATPDSPNTSSGEKRTRRFVGLKRNSLKHGVGGTSNGNGNGTGTNGSMIGGSASRDDLSPVSSPSPQMRRFASKKNDLIAQKEKELAESAAAGSAGDEPRTRRFAGMRRDTWSGDRYPLRSRAVVFARTHAHTHVSDEIPVCVTGPHSELAAIRRASWTRCRRCRAAFRRWRRRRPRQQRRPRCASLRASSARTTRSFSLLFAKKKK